MVELDMDITYYAAALKKKQAELSQVTRDDIAIDYVADELDNIVNRQHRESALRDKDRNAITLRRVRAALQRIQTGEYGNCIMCDKAVPEARLRALPYAERCIPCQEQHEDDKLSIDAALAEAD